MEVIRQFMRCHPLIRKLDAPVLRILVGRLAQPQNFPDVGPLVDVYDLSGENEDQSCDLSEDAVPVMAVTTFAGHLNASLENRFDFRLSEHQSSQGLSPGAGRSIASSQVSGGSLGCSAGLFSPSRQQSMQKSSSGVP